MAPTYEDVTFERDCEAVVIPDGHQTMIPTGTLGFVTQVLGGNYTLQLANGYLVRVAGEDGDAIGKEVIEGPKAQRDVDGNVVVSDEQVWEQLRTIYDPEIPVDIVELGLVYQCDLEKLVDADGYRVAIDMTLTAPGCGMGQVLQDDVAYKVRSIPGVAEADVNLVFDPPWGPEKMSEAARLELGFF